MIRGAWCGDKKRVPKLTLAGGFRLIRAFTFEHNAQRLRTHVDRLGHQMKVGAAHRKFRLRIRRQRLKEKARHLAQQPDVGQGGGNHLAASITTL